MNEFEQTYEAGWVRWIDGVGYSDGEARAQQWIARHAIDCGAQPILLTPTKHRIGVDDPWARFLRGGHNATARSHGRVRGPVAALWTDWKLLDIGEMLARNSALCVLERPDLSMVGWARQVGAIDLMSGATAEPFTPEQDEALGALAFEGYKGYSGDTSKGIARRYLAELASFGIGDRVTVMGALAARGVSVAGLGEIAKLNGARTGRPTALRRSRTR